MATNIVDSMKIEYYQIFSLNQSGTQGAQEFWCPGTRTLVPPMFLTDKKENNYWKSVRLHCRENKDNNGNRISDPPELKDNLSSKAKRNGYQSACYRVVVSLLQVILAKLGSTRGRSRLGHTPSEHHLGRKKTSNAMNSQRDLFQLSRTAPQVTLSLINSLTF